MTASIFTAGIVSPRSAASRTAKYTRQTRNATRVALAQNAMALEHQRQQLAQDHVHHVQSQVNAVEIASHQQRAAATPQPMNPPPYVPNSIPAGWYDDGNGMTRWYDGQRWTPHTR